MGRARLGGVRGLWSVKRPTVNKFLVAIATFRRSLYCATLMGGAGVRRYIRRDGDCMRITADRIADLFYSVGPLNPCPRCSEHAPLLILGYMPAAEFSYEMDDGARVSRPEDLFAVACKSCGYVMLHHIGAMLASREERNSREAGNAPD